MIEIVPGKCVLCGVCEGVAPDLFTQHDDRGWVEVHQEAARRNQDLAQLAIEVCPMGCIVEGP